MHGNGIYAVSGVELLGKPIFDFTAVLTIPRGVAGKVDSGDVSIHFTSCFPPFGSISEGLTSYLRTMIADCSIVTNFIRDMNITQGSYNVTYNKSFWDFVFEDYVIDKDLRGSIPGDEMGHISNMFTLHHSICDNPTLPSTATVFPVTIYGTGIYTGSIINYL